MMKGKHSNCTWRKKQEWLDWLIYHNIAWAKVCISLTEIKKKNKTAKTSLFHWRSLQIISQTDCYETIGTDAPLVMSIWIIIVIELLININRWNRRKKNTTQRIIEIGHLYKQFFFFSFYKPISEIWSVIVYSFNACYFIIILNKTVHLLFIWCTD